jgi:hypothetical protein
MINTNGWLLSQITPFSVGSVPLSERQSGLQLSFQTLLARLFEGADEYRWFPLDR